MLLLVSMPNTNDLDPKNKNTILVLKGKKSICQFHKNSHVGLRTATFLCFNFSWFGSKKHNVLTVKEYQEKEYSVFR